VVRAEVEWRLFETLTSEVEPIATEPSDTELATKLVAELGAEKAIERLLARLRRDGPCEPLPVTTLPLHESRTQVRVARAPQRRAPTHRRARHG
jgi:hypothetical protein